MRYQIVIQLCKSDEPPDETNVFPSDSEEIRTFEMVLDDEEAPGGTRGEFEEVLKQKVESMIEQALASCPGCAGWPHYGPECPICGSL